MKERLLGFLFNKYTIILSFTFVFYVFSWFLWINYTGPEENFISERNVKVYNYFNGPMQKFNYEVMSLGGKNMGAELVESESLINFAHFFYHPLELAGNYFEFQYISEFYKTNMHNLVEFNASSEESKMKQYGKFKKYHGTIFGSFDSRKYDYDFKIKSEALSKKYNITSFLAEEFFIGDENKKGSLAKRHNHDWSSERFFYNFSDYEKTVLEGNKFIKWFNKVNITENNPNFDKEFVKNYQQYLIEKEKR